MVLEQFFISVQTYPKTFLRFVIGHKKSDNILSTNRMQS